ncbi:ubiquitin carboxyl-terminal hydrolase family protein [Cryptosporidium andersoni]|uniref:Ubiquitin carboxyl-terminal hydrolase family protein n=1 Tax=Cryptosporidium andersoni TaxID=117008 RepID=A0A1J4MRK1_9CRYT|nr:ubiquitin carboxyl-terminal hydrolase family protein [Cryptosporidium andersoni]
MPSNRFIGKPQMGSTMNGGLGIEKQYDYLHIPQCLPNELEFVVRDFRNKIVNMMNNGDGNNRNRLYSQTHNYRNFNFRLMILPKVKLSPGGSLDGHISAYLEAVPLENWPSNWVWINTRYTVTLVNQRDYRKSHFMSDIFNFKGENIIKKNPGKNLEFVSAGPEADRGWSEYFNLKTLLDSKSGFMDPTSETVVFRAGVYPITCEPTSYGKGNMDTIGTERSATGYVGLRNLGATCYMNSLLQSLYHIGHFRKAVYAIPLDVEQLSDPSDSNDSAQSPEGSSSKSSYSFSPEVQSNTNSPPSTSSPDIQFTNLPVMLLGNASSDAIDWSSEDARHLLVFESDMIMLNEGMTSLESIVSNVNNSDKQCNNNSNKNLNRISLALQTLFYELQTSSDAVSCRELLKSFGWDAADAFTQHDAQELNRLLCDRLEEEMKSTNVDGTIKALFEGEYENYIECLDVDCTSKRTENFYDLQVDVKGVNSLEESLEKFVEEEILDGDNLYEAEGFGKQRAKKGVRFQRFPPVIQFHLKRFQFNLQSMDMVKLNDYFAFPEVLDLSNYIQRGNEVSNRNISSKDKDLYVLHTVVIHQGDVHSGHYYAYIRPRPNMNWLRFDDEKVTVVSTSTAMEDNFGGYEYDVWDYLGNPDRDIPRRSKTHSAYILVYVKRDLASELLKEPIPEEINSDLVLKCRRETELLKTRKKLRYDINEHVRIQLIFSISYDISNNTRSKLSGLHNTVHSFPWNCIFKCPRDFPINQLHSELEKKFVRSRKSGNNQIGSNHTVDDTNNNLGSFLFLLENHDNRQNDGNIGASCLLFSTCISSSINGLGNRGYLNRNLSSGNVVLSDLCRRYHREGLWDSSCPTLYMCLYTPPEYDVVENGITLDESYMEEREKIENKLRRLDDGGYQVLLVLRYFDIFSSDINESYTHGSSINNLHNIGMIMVSQNTKLKDLNDYIFMEIKRGILLGRIHEVPHITDDSTKEYKFRICQEKIGDQGKLFPLLDPRYTINQLQLTNGSSLIFSWNLEDSVIKSRRDELQLSLLEIPSLSSSWLGQNIVTQSDQVSDLHDISLKLPEFPVLDFHYWFENQQNTVEISINIWDPLNLSLLFENCLQNMGTSDMEDKSPVSLSLNNTVTGSNCKIKIKEVHNIKLDLRWPILKTWFYICKVIHVDPRCLAIGRNGISSSDTVLYSIYKLLAENQYVQTVGHLLHQLYPNHHHSRTHNFSLIGIVLMDCTFSSLVDENKHIFCIDCMDQNLNLRSRYFVNANLFDSFGDIIKNIASGNCIVTQSGEDINKVFGSIDNLRFFEGSNSSSMFSIYREHDKIANMQSVRNQQNNRKTIYLSFFTDTLRLELDYTDEERRLLQQGDIYNVLIIQATKEMDSGGYALLITTPRNSKVVDIKNIVKEKLLLDEKVISRWRFYRYEQRAMEFIRDNEIITPRNINSTMNFYGFMPHVVLLAQHFQSNTLSKSHNSRPLRI